MSDQPRVSVIMAVKNAARYLPAALDSVVGQTQPPTEVILVDGGSTDETLAVAARYRQVRVIHETGRGYASAWNDGILASAGDLVAFLDSDDLWAIQKLEWQLHALATAPEARCAIGHVQFFAAPGRSLPPSFKPELLDRPHVAYMPGALLARRDVFDDVGLFDPAWTIANDIDWFAKLKDRGIAVVVVPRVVIRKRIHDGNLSYLSARTPVINSEMIRVLRRSIHRQRQQAVGSGPEKPDRS